MTKTLTRAELEKLAKSHALQVLSADAADNAREKAYAELLTRFQAEYQPLLADKPYTALFRTYNNLVLTAIQNHYEPGSALPDPPVRVSSIGDGEVIHRRNFIQMNEEAWAEYVQELTALAEQFGREIVEMIKNGEDVDQRMEEQQMEASVFAMDHGLTEEESERDASIYKEAFLRTLSEATRVAT